MVRPPLKDRPRYWTKTISLRLGMTSGALVAFTIVWLVVFFALWKQYDLNQQTKDFAKSNRTLLQRIRENQISIRRLAVQGAEAHAGACALIGDFRFREMILQAQQNEARAFLRAHPNGIGDITPDLLRASIDRTEATLAGLRSSRSALEVKLHCPAGRTG